MTTSNRFEPAQEPSVITLPPVVPVRDLRVRMWLESMNIPFDKPVVLQFVREDEPLFHDQGNATNHLLRQCGPACSAEDKVVIDALKDIPNGF